jgi:quinol monooxygenase YgiN
MVTMPAGDLWMQVFFNLLVSATIFAVGFPVISPHAAAQEPAVYVAIYVETQPQVAEQAITALKAEAAASRAEAGSVAVQLLREIGRDTRFVMFEIWKDQAAFDAHRKDPHLQAFRDQLKATLTAPPDERVLTGLWPGPAANHPSAHAVWVVTHVDVMPSYADEVAGMLKGLGEESVKESGYLLFTVTQQIGRPNHFTVEEGWASHLAFDAHEALASTRQFRDKISPMLGALYDQRVYQGLE